MLFCIGIKLTRRAVRLFSDFYQSDIIVASPLGLVTWLAEVAASGGEKKSKQKQQSTVDANNNNDSVGKAMDFLSSLEVLP